MTPPLAHIRSRVRQRLRRRPASSDQSRHGDHARHRVVVVGGGFGGLPACRFLGNEPVDVTLLDRRNHHLFQPLLYQVATGILSPGQIAPPLRQVLRRHSNIEVELAEVTGFDLDQRIVHATRPIDGDIEVPVRQPHRRGRGHAVVLRERRARALRSRHEDDRRRPRAPTPHLWRLRDGRGDEGPRRATEVADDRDRRRRPDRRGARRPDPRARGAQPEEELPHLRPGVGPRAAHGRWRRSRSRRSATGCRRRPRTSSRGSASSCGWARGSRTSTPWASTSDRQRHRARRGAHR